MHFFLNHELHLYVCFLTISLTQLAAWETLGIPAKKKSYDSIDPQFDDSVPAVSSESKEKFFVVFRPFFEQNAR